jgi:hypothetical protein
MSGLLFFLLFAVIMATIFGRAIAEERCKRREQQRGFDVGSPTREKPS